MHSSGLTLPLARITIAASVLAFGNNPSAWRLPSFIAGFLALAVIYQLGSTLFSKKVGLIAAFLLAFDGLSFAQSRIATTDSLLVLLSLTSILLALRSNLLLSSILVGLAISTKWVAIVLIPIILFITITNNPKSNRRINYFLIALIIPTLVYLAVYLPFFAAGQNIINFLLLQAKMFYHGFNSTEVHPFQSQWWQWPFGIKPVFYYKNLQNQLWAIPNLVVFLLGVISLTATFQYIKRSTIQNQSKALTINLRRNILFIFISYFAFLFPWIFIDLFTNNQRPTFIYYYLPCLPFLHLISAHWLNRLLSQKRSLSWFLATTTLVTIPIAFLLIYPHLNGL